MERVEYREPNGRILSVFRRNVPFRELNACILTLMVNTGSNTDEKTMQSDVCREGYKKSKEI